MVGRGLRGDSTVNIRKIIKLVVTALVAFGMAATIGSWLHKKRLEQIPPPPAPRIELPNALVVFYFHGNKLSPRCEKIEKVTLEVLEKSFAKELKNGRLLWRKENYVDPKNAHFVEEYQITTTCIVLADGRPGSRFDWKGFQPKTWELVDDKDKDKYINFMRTEIQASLK